MDTETERNDVEQRPRLDLAELLSRKIVGQAEALRFIVPYIQTYQAGLSSPDRPAGVFLLLGPTGTGKTRTVEALAEILHGSAKRLLRVDCAEYQSEHDVARLIGAPPGYIGHRDTKPLLTQERLHDAISDDCDLALVLFDEVEKAAASLTTLLLGTLDTGLLRLGDNNVVNFEKTLIFLTSNLGAREMLKEVQPEMGFQPAKRPSATELAGKLESIALAQVRKRFSPEFLNRIDAVITYQPLDGAALKVILDQHIAELQRHVQTRLGPRSFAIEVSQSARQLLLEKGFNQEYGARELKRTIHRLLTQPLAALVAEGRIMEGSCVTVDADESGAGLTIRGDRPVAISDPSTAAPVVLVLDDNAQLLKCLQRELIQAGINSIPAGTAKEARAAAARQAVDLAIVDMVLPDGDGLSVAAELRQRQPHLRVVVMTGSEMSLEEVAVCERLDYPVLRKPFIAGELVALVKARLQLSASASG